jgi:hypothetical protein
MLPPSFVVWLYNPRINWKKYDSEIKEYIQGKECGITYEKRNPKVIISLTSYPARIPHIHRTIFSLLKQSVKPDEIILWLGEELFPNRNNDLPEILLMLFKHGLTINYCKDIKSFTKLIPVMCTYPNDIIVTVDDDIIYSPKLLETLLNSYEIDKTLIHAHIANKILFTSNGVLKPFDEFEMKPENMVASYLNIQGGIGGCLYPPKSLHKDFVNETLFMNLCPTADDLWFWAMAVMNETKIIVIKNNIIASTPNTPIQYKDVIEPKNSLGSINCINGQKQNNIQLHNILEHYPIIKERLKKS